MASTLRLKLCPWRDFVNVELYSAATSKERILTNLKENTANYLLILALIFVIGSCVVFNYTILSSIFYKNWISEILSI